MDSRTKNRASCIAVEAESPTRRGHQTSSRSEIHDSIGQHFAIASLSVDTQLLERGSIRLSQSVCWQPCQIDDRARLKPHLHYLKAA